MSERDGAATPEAWTLRALDAGGRRLLLAGLDEVYGYARRHAGVDEAASLTLPTIPGGTWLDYRKQQGRRLGEWITQLRLPRGAPLLCRGGDPYALSAALSRGAPHRKTVISETAASTPHAQYTCYVLLRALEARREGFTVAPWEEARRLIAQPEPGATAHGVDALTLALAAVSEKQGEIDSHLSLDERLGVYCHFLDVSSGWPREADPEAIFRSLLAVNRWSRGAAPASSILVSDAASRDRRRLLTAYFRACRDAGLLNFTAKTRGDEKDHSTIILVKGYEGNPAAATLREAYRTLNARISLHGRPQGDPPAPAGEAGAPARETPHAAPKETRSA